MEFNTFDEGVVPGGVRSKNDIRTLICYLFCAVGKPMSKQIVLSALQKKGLANYFESSACFDDLIKFGNIELVDEENKLYYATKNGKIIFEQLESTLALTVKERAYSCALSLLEQQQIEKENTVTINKIDNGYTVNCRISGGDTDLFSFEFYVPDHNQARLIKKNFQKKPDVIYKTMIAMLTKDKEYVRDALKDIDTLA